jgi:hypothetical protein
VILAAKAASAPSRRRLPSRAPRSSPTSRRPGPSSAWLTRDGSSCKSSRARMVSSPLPARDPVKRAERSLLRVSRPRRTPRFSESTRPARTT